MSRPAIAHRDDRTPARLAPAARTALGATRPAEPSVLQGSPRCRLHEAAPGRAMSLAMTTDPSTGTKPAGPQLRPGPRQTPPPPPTVDAPRPAHESRIARCWTSSSPHRTPRRSDARSPRTKRSGTQTLPVSLPSRPTQSRSAATPMSLSVSQTPRNDTILAPRRVPHHYARQLPCLLAAPPLSRCTPHPKCHPSRLQSQPEPSQTLAALSPSTAMRRLATSASIGHRHPTPCAARSPPRSAHCPRAPPPAHSTPRVPSPASTPPPSVTRSQTPPPRFPAAATTAGTLRTDARGTATPTNLDQSPAARGTMSRHSKSWSPGRHPPHTANARPHPTLAHPAPAQTCHPSALQTTASPPMCPSATAPVSPPAKSHRHHGMSLESDRPPRCTDSTPRRSSRCTNVPPVVPARSQRGRPQMGSLGPKCAASGLHPRFPLVSSTRVGPLRTDSPACAPLRPTRAPLGPLQTQPRASLARLHQAPPPRDARQSPLRPDGNARPCRSSSPPRTPRRPHERCSSHTAPHQSPYPTRAPPCLPRLHPATSPAPPLCDSLTGCTTLGSRHPPHMTPNPSPMHAHVTLVPAVHDCSSCLPPAAPAAATLQAQMMGQPQTHRTSRSRQPLRQEPRPPSPRPLGAPPPSCRALCAPLEPTTLLHQHGLSHAHATRPPQETHRPPPPPTRLPLQTHCGGPDSSPAPRTPLASRSLPHTPTPHFQPTHAPAVALPCPRAPTPPPDDCRSTPPHSPPRLPRTPSPHQQPDQCH
mmetsp:Transcript_10446/g.33173  ORF Transcript_10446/g.33173 Transcript_10446/m.33173 type:complete len:757 (-) Transcript_10446:2654-4924(-)